MGVTLGLEFAAQLPVVVRNELEQLVAAIQLALNAITPGINPATIPKCRAYGLTLQTVPTAAFAIVEFDREDEDPLGMHDLQPGANALVKIPTTGIYMVRTQIRWNAPTGSRQVEIATTRKGSVAQVLSISGPAITIMECTYLGELEAGDAVFVLVYQDSGGPITIGNTIRRYANELSVVQLIDTSGVIKI